MSNMTPAPTPFRPYAAGTQPDYDVPTYGSTSKRHPKLPLVRLPHTITEIAGPRFAADRFPPTSDLARIDGREAMGERIIVAGTVTDEDGKPVPHTMIEIWQANAAGRYQIDRDQHNAPLDPNFRGAGRVFTDAEGCYRF